MVGLLIGVSISGMVLIFFNVSIYPWHDMGSRPGHSTQFGCRYYRMLNESFVLQSNKHLTLQWLAYGFWYQARTQGGSGGSDEPPSKSKGPLF